MIGALGACFGRVVTLDSPRARPPGTFNWQATLWHELAHVITLQMSEPAHSAMAHRRHLGLRGDSGAARVGPGHGPRVRRSARARQGHRLPDLNAGFMDPTTISMAYYEASLLVEHLVERTAQPALEALRAQLRGRRRHRSGDEEDDGHVDSTTCRPLFTEWLNERVRAASSRRRRAPDDVVIAPSMPRRNDREVAREHPGYFDVHCGSASLARGRRHGRGLCGVDPRR